MKKVWILISIVLLIFFIFFVIPDKKIDTKELLQNSLSENHLIYDSIEVNDYSIIVYRSSPENFEQIVFILINSHHFYPEKDYYYVEYPEMSYAISKENVDKLLNNELTPSEFYSKIHMIPTHFSKVILL